MSCQAEPVEARLIQNHIAFNKLPEIIRQAERLLNAGK
jgi:hypothetical protein